MLSFQVDFSRFHSLRKCCVRQHLPLAAFARRRRAALRHFKSSSLFFVFFSVFRDLDLFSELKKLLCRSPTLTQRLLSLLLLWWRLCVGRLSVCSDPCVLVCPLFLRRAVTAEAVGFLSAVGVFIAALALVFLFINKMLCFSRVGGAPCLEQSRRSRNERSPGLRQGLGETPPLHADPFARPHSSRGFGSTMLVALCASPGRLLSGDEMMTPH